MPSSACSARLRPSNENGRVTTATVSAPISSLAICAMTGAAPVPVPPPSPAVMKTMSAPCSASLISARFSSAAWTPTSGSAPAPKTLRQVHADVDLVVGVAHQQRLRVGVHRDELDALDAGLDHAVHGVGTAATHSEDLDHSQVVRACLEHCASPWATGVPVDSP